MTLEQAALRPSKLSGKPIRLYSTRDFGREQYPEGRSVVVADDTAAEIVSRLKKELGARLVAFVGCTHSAAEGAEPGSEVVVAEGTSQADILKIAQLWTEHISTEGLVRRFQEYDRLYGIDFLQAESDTVEFKLLSMPEDVQAFSDDLCEICLDDMEEGIITDAETLEEHIANDQPIHLWWD